VKTASWRASAPRWRRGAPPGFLRPCEPALVRHPPTGPGWLQEIKHDGFRIVALKQGERVKVRTRGGANFTDRHVKIAEAVEGPLAAENLGLLNGGKRYVPTRSSPTKRKISHNGHGHICRSLNVQSSRNINARKDCSPLAAKVRE
jgi:hypothetical protein